MKGYLRSAGEAAVPPPVARVTGGTGTVLVTSPPSASSPWRIPASHGYPVLEAGWRGAPARFDAALV